MQRVLITGATSGIGLAAARAFLSAGHAVWLHGRTREKAKKAAAQLQNLGGECTPVWADLEDEAQVNALCGQLPEQLDIFISNAGGRVAAGNNGFRQALETNLVSALTLSREAARRGANSIVFTGSIRGFVHGASGAEYSAAKGGLQAMCAALALELAPTTRVNAVAPGFTQTPLHAGGEARLTKEAANTPLGRVISPEEVANAILFLALAGGITGAVLAVDGGRSLYR